MADVSAAIEMTYDTSKQADQAGACRDFWMRFPGLRAASDNDSAGAVIYYLENPYQRDLVILQAIAVITTLDAQDGDIDVGLADDATGTNVGAEVIDSLVNTAVGALECMATQAVTGVARPIWKAKDNSTDAFLVVYQNADADASDLRWTLLLRVIPYEDMINSSVELGAITVA
jgi:hypothetical protein